MINDKSIAVLDPESIPPIHIIGCGAVGSKIATLIARLGIDNINVYDFDKVEEHNIGNQDFFIDQIGKPKAVATLELVNKTSGMVIKAHDMRVNDTVDLRGFVFLCVDKMEARAEISRAFINAYENELTHTTPSFLLDARMALYEFGVYALDPSKEKAIKAYVNSLYTSADVKEELRSACGRVQGLGSISSMTASLMVQYFVQHTQGKLLPEVTVVNTEHGIQTIMFGKNSV